MSLLTVAFTNLSGAPKPVESEYKLRWKATRPKGSFLRKISGADTSQNSGILGPCATTHTDTQIYTPQETLIYIHGIQIYSNGFFTPFCTCHECPARQFDPLTRASVYINTRISRRARAFVCVLIYVYGFTTCCRGQKGRETATANDLLSLGCELF